MNSMRMLLALERNRTTAVFGHHHYCKRHEQIVDHKHINYCDLLKRKNVKNSEIVAPLEKVDTIRELEPTVMKKMEDEVMWLVKRIETIENKIYFLIKAKRPTFIC